VRLGIGEVAIVGTPIRAAVSVNGIPVGTLPLSAPVRVGEGPAVIEVHAPGYAPLKQSVAVFGGKHRDLIVHLNPLDRPPPPKLDLAEAEDQSGDREEASHSAPKPSEPAPAQSPPNGDRGVLRPAAWVAAGVALAGLGFGVFETFNLRSKQSQFDSQTKPSQADPTKTIAACGSEEPNRGSLPICGSLYGEISSARTLAIVGYVLGGGLALGSAVLFVLASGNSDADRRDALVCGPGESLRGVACAFHF
jgi:hypothetical protein